MSRIFRIYEISKMRRFSVTIGFFWGAVSVAVGEPSRSRCSRRALPVSMPSGRRALPVSMLHKLLDISCEGVLNFITWGWPRCARGVRGWKPRLPVPVVILETAPTGGDSSCSVHVVIAVGNRAYRAC